MTSLPNLKEVRRLRQLAGLTQNSLAKALGVSQSFIAKLERGRLQPSYEKAKRVFDYLEGAPAGEESR